MLSRRGLSFVVALVIFLSATTGVLAEIVDRVEMDDGAYALFYFATEEDQANFNYYLNEAYNSSGDLEYADERILTPDGEYGTKFSYYVGGELYEYFVSIGNRSSHYNAQGQLQGYNTQQDNRTDYFDATGTLLQYDVYDDTGVVSYDADGRKFSSFNFEEEYETQYLYGPDKQLTSITEHRWEMKDGVSRSTTTYYDAAYRLLGSRVAWDVQEGTRIESFTPAGALTEYSIITYRDNTTKEEFFNPAGNLLRYTVTSYQKDAPIVTQEYDAAGKLLSYTQVEISEDGFRTVEHYDEKGNLLKVEIFDKRGNLVSETLVPQVKYTWYPSNTLSTFGLSLRDLRPELTDKWYNVTPVDLSRDGTQVMELVASNLFIVGQVAVKVAGDEVVVEYSAKGMNNDTLRMESEFFTFFSSLSEIETVEPEEIGEGFAFGESISIADDLGGAEKVLLFVRNVATYRDHLTKNIKYQRLWPNQPHRREMRQQMLEFIGE